MSPDRRHGIIRARQGQLEEPEKTFFVSDLEPVAVEGVPDVTVRYISVTGPNSHGIEEGVYVQTNVTPESHDASRLLRTAIIARASLSLTYEIESIIGGNPKHQGIILQPAFLAPNGAVVLKVS